MKKTLISVFLLLTLLVVCFVSCDNAEEYKKAPEPLSASEGLEFVSNGGGTCYVSGIGSCTDTNIIIPSKSPSGDKVTGIGERAFHDCDTIKSVRIADTVTVIGEAAFSFCDSLRSVNIGDGVKTISVDAFCYCPELSKVSIGKGLVTIEEYAFYVCPSLDEFSVNSENTIFKSVDGVLYSNDGKTLIKYPEGKTDTAYKIPISVTRISKEAFMDCTYLEEVIISDNVKSIGDYAFFCADITKVTIGIGVKSIGEGAFEDSGITTVNYVGDQESWAKISIGADNDVLASATINYNYSAK